MPQYTIQELEKQTCQSFGGINCVLHQCMYECVLEKAKKNTAKGGKFAYKGYGYCPHCGYETNHCKCS